LLTGGAGHFTRYYAPTLAMMTISPESVQQQLEQLRASNREIYATSLALSVLPDVNWWQPIAKFCQNSSLESRGPYELMLYRFTPNGLGQSQEANTNELACQNIEEDWLTQ
jgi:NifB/MoaA-like Fe-S oxidoreductase